MKYIYSVALECQSRVTAIDQHEREVIMKRIMMTMILLVLLGTLAACSKKDGKDLHSDKKSSGLATVESGNEDEANESEESNQDKSGEESGAAASEATEAGSAAVIPAGSESATTDLIDLSEELVLQMARGDFDRTHQLFTPMIKLQLTKGGLKAAWEATVADLGEYIEIYSVQETKEGASSNVNAILKYENYGLKVTLVYNEKGELDGLWFNYATAGMELETTEDYSEQAIRIGEGEDYPVDGILTLPKGVAKPPVILLVHGSGTHDWDETVGAGVNKPFRDLAQGLAERGIATIRYQERLAAYPELAAERITIQIDALDDVSAAIAFAAGCDLVDTGRIYVLGHSLGGMLAPKIAAEHKEVKGILSLAGSPRKLEDIAADQQELLGGRSKKEVTEARKQAEEVKGLTEEAAGIYLGMPASYWYSLNQIDTPELLKTLKVPMFIAQGSVDFQIYADRDYTEWQRLLEGRENVTFQLYDNLNHLFMVSNGRSDMSEYLIPSSVDAQVIEDIAAWVKELNP